MLDSGLARPDPYVIRDGSTIYRPESFLEASEILSELLADGRDDDKLKRIDVGMMQVNLFWHGQRVEELDELLIPAINIMVGSQILAKALASKARSLEERVGRYHSWTPKLAKPYGSSVIQISCGIGWQHEVCGGQVQ
ncbi:hypothetical protein AQ621_16400 (plasmid) [Marinobacter sp. P4B1]|nr:hypothetical protein AQ621_16400 [Marinobacter sp. P4B1]